MRIAGRLIGTAALLLVAVGAPAAAKPPAKGAAADWSQTVTATPEGGYRMGRPNAPIAVVEYASLVCSHCRHFAQTGTASLIAGYVRTGKVSYEVRPFMLSGLDIAATLLATCGGGRAFFPIAHDLYATQDQWATRIGESDNRRIAAMPETDMYAEFARTAAIGPVAAAHGVAPRQADKCLRDPAAALRLASMVQKAEGLGVTGTPTFFVNGRKVDAYDWPTLKPLLGKS